ncbi:MULTISPECIES: hypothetical protein [Arenibacter]|uniref:hypothetical protein n=1 Tax=Arenibacter TaxID=178469 RepID=UPI000A37FF58|nr:MULTISPECIES: hypothetical protein [Arenibacter]
MISTIVKELIQSKTTSFRYFLIFPAIVFILLIARIGSYDLEETSETRYAEISREMLVSSDYLPSQLLGIYH